MEESSWNCDGLRNTEQPGKVNKFKLKAEKPLGISH
jgi:hypothetical protein